MEHCIKRLALGGLLIYILRQTKKSLQCFFFIRRDTVLEVGGAVAIIKGGFGRGQDSDNNQMRLYAKIMVSWWY